MDICSNILFLRILFYLQTALKIMRFVVPIMLIVRVGLDFYKGMIANDANLQKENIEKSSKRILAAIIVFFIPTIINCLMSLIEYAVGEEENYQNCIVNLDSIDYYEELKYYEDQMNEQLEKEKALTNYEKNMQELAKLLETNKKNMDSETSDGKFLGQKYKLSEKELKDIAKICQAEQGTPGGAAKEASLMANKYELLSKDSKYKNKGLHYYVLNCDWWAPAKKGTYSSVKLKPNVLEAVRKVLVDGQRVFPLYIDDHDWLGDISRITVNGKSYSGRDNLRNRKLYVQDKTRIYNIYGSVYIYWTHAHGGKDADPFGYKPATKKKVEAMNAK